MDMLIRASLNSKLYHLNVRCTSDYNQMRPLAWDYVTNDKLIGPVVFTNLSLTQL